MGSIEFREMGIGARTGDIPRVVRDGQTSSWSEIVSPVRVYLNASGEYPLLTANEEKVLGWQIQAGMRMSAYLGAEGLEMPEDFDGSTLEVMVVDHTLHEAREALDRMVLSNLRLVDAVARRFTWSSLSYDELLHDGVTGLIKAAKKFDPNRNNKFSTPAVWWIRRSIEQGIEKTAREIRLPEHIEEQLTSIRKIWREDPGRELASICAEHEFNLELIEKGLTAAERPLSFQKPLYEDDPSGADGVLGDVLTWYVPPGTTAGMEAAEDRIAQNMTAALKPQFGERTEAIVHVIRRVTLEGAPTVDVAAEIKRSTESVRRLNIAGLNYLRTLGKDAVLFLINQENADQPEELYAGQPELAVAG